MQKVETSSSIPENHSIFDLISTHAGSGIGRVSLQGRFLSVNSRFCDLLGYQPAELEQKTFVDITHPEDIEKSLHWLKELVDGRVESINGEKRYFHKRGHVLWVKVTIVPVRDQLGSLHSFLTTFENITEHRISLDLLRHQKEVLELMAKNLPLTQTLTRIIELIEKLASGCVSSIFLVKDGKLIGGVAPSLPESFTKAVNSNPVGPENGSCAAAAYYRKRIIAHDVKTDPHSVKARDIMLAYGLQASWSTPVLDQEGRVLGTVSMCWREPKEPTEWHYEFFDVATYLMGLAVERDRTESLLREQQVKMMTSSKLAALGEMAGSLAHEINNPLAIINVRADQLALAADRDRVTPKLCYEISGSIQQTTERISKIIRGLRAFARDGEQDPIQEICLQNVIEDTLSFCRERFRSQAIDLRLEISSHLKLRCRPVQLAQVLLNLLNNSFDAVEKVPVKWVELSARESGSMIEISVMDSGPGIPEHLRDRVIEPFFTTKDVNKGTGLGLSISSAIISSHQGSLQLDPTAAHTCFRIRLPRK